MTDNLTISSESPAHPAMDYAFLRQEGIRHLERMAGDLWTDFNAHDPGITILEQLCYAITDLGYRIDYDIKDLLASEAANPYRSLYSPAEILTTNPVTLTDLRKVVIDVAGVKNAWLEPVEQPVPGVFYDPSDQSLYLEPASHRQPVSVRGVYRVWVETDGSRLTTELEPEVRGRLHACRNLCEDFEPPTILPPQSIIVNADIEIGEVEDPDQLLAEIYHALAGFISPRIRFYSLSEMIDRGKRIDEIMDGPVLQHGFIDTEELERFERKEALRTSDLIHEIMDVEGVIAVSDINLSDGSKSVDWYLTLDRNNTPFLDLEKSLYDVKGPTIRLVKGRVVARPDATRVEKIFKELQEAARYKQLPESQRDIRLPAGRNRKVEHYHSIQHHFPAVYGIGELGLPVSAPAQRKAQARQLKAYLMFFDQLLANYFAQLANVKELFSFHSQQPHTYFYQMIDDPRLKLDEDEIRKNDKTTHATKLQDITENPHGEDLTPYYGRKNRFLNHLLARFAEEFTDYTLLQYADFKPGDLISDKYAFLQDYREIGAARGRAFNYIRPSWDTNNVSGLAKRISRKLGLSTYHRRDLTGMDADNEGGFHMVEHILLRPQKADMNQWTRADEVAAQWQAAALLARPQHTDPYSLQLSFIFPDWVNRYKAQDFRDFIWKTLREETPVHIGIRLHWLNREDMRAFEAAYSAWLERDNPTTMNAKNIKARDARDRMINILGIGIPYPQRDLGLQYPAMVSLNQQADIHILGGQTGITYQLCDEDGNPIVDKKGNTFKVLVEERTGEDGVVLRTPKIVKDITFTILACREDKVLDICLETYLNQTVSIKAGIDTTLQVAFQPAGDQVTSNHQIIINYGDKVKVAIAASQEGISYVLVKNADEPISDTKKGNKGDIALDSSELSELKEDIEIKVKAFRTAKPKDFKYLDAPLSVKVRPNQEVTVSLDVSTIDYKARARLYLADPQSSAEYQLYQRELVISDYLSQKTEGCLVVQTDEGGSVYIKAPEKVTNWDDMPGFDSIGLFTKGEGERENELSITTDSLREDTLFIVRATKKENRESLQLDQAVVVLVRPDTAPAVKAQQPLIDSNTSGMVTVSGTQKGVAYQLRLDENNEPVNPPGYHLEDRGIETTRLEVDFVVEDRGDPSVLLPTKKLTQTMTFNVLATKILTGVSAQLKDKVKIEIEVRPVSGGKKPPG